MARFCNVTVVDQNGERHTLSFVAKSRNDAAHLYLTMAKSGDPDFAVPIPTLDSTFEVTFDGHLKPLRVGGRALQTWIERQRKELKGPVGLLFRQRPVLE